MKMMANMTTNLRTAEITMWNSGDRSGGVRIGRDMASRRCERMTREVQR
jgi:hypothetical protein